MSKRIPVGVQSCSGLPQNAFRKTSSACSLSGNPSVLFPEQHICHFNQCEAAQDHTLQQDNIQATHPKFDGLVPLTTRIQ